jgi:tripartite-type tricarboxylate transporter receptor subunit TctC
MQAIRPALDPQLRAGNRPGGKGMTTRSNGSAPLLLAALLVLTAALPEASAQDTYPSRPIRMILPVAPGGGTDALARLIGQGLFERWGRQVVVESRTGAGTLIASDLVAKSRPDGHTLLMTTSTHSINPAVYKKMPYDTLRDFAPITQAEIETRHESNAAAQVLR